MTENQYQNLVLDLRMMSKRIGAIEERCGCKVKWKVEIDNRINGIEALLKKAPPIFLDKPKQERIKPCDHSFDRYGECSKCGKMDTTLDDTIQVSREVAQEWVHMHFGGFEIGTPSNNLFNELKKELDK